MEYSLYIVHTYMAIDIPKDTRLHNVHGCGCVTTKLLKTTNTFPTNPQNNNPHNTPTLQLATTMYDWTTLR